MAYLTVTTQADVVNPGDGKLSLREAVAQANASASADTIRFVASLAGKTLVLTGGELVINQDLTIDGAGQGVTLSGGGTQRLLRTSGTGTDLAVRGLDSGFRFCPGSRRRGRVHRRRQLERCQLHHPRQ